MVSRLLPRNIFGNPAPIERCQPTSQGHPLLMRQLAGQLMRFEGLLVLLRGFHDVM